MVGRTEINGLALWAEIGKFFTTNLPTLLETGTKIYTAQQQAAAAKDAARKAQISKALELAAQNVETQRILDEQKVIAAEKVKAEQETQAAKEEIAKIQQAEAAPAMTTPAAIIAAATAQPWIPIVVVGGIILAGGALYLIARRK